MIHSLVLHKQNCKVQNKKKDSSLKFFIQALSKTLGIIYPV